MMKKKISILLLLSFLISGTVVLADGKFKKIEVFFDRVNLTINGNPTELNRDSLIYNGTIYMPLRNISDALGAEVSWDDQSKAVNLDFILDEKAQTVFNASKKGIYQYVTIQNNDIMNEMIKQFKNDNMAKMKEVLARYEGLRDIADALQDNELKLIIDKMITSGELMRSGYASKNLDDYYLAWTIFNTNAGNLITLLRDRIASSIEPNSQ